MKKIGILFIFKSRWVGGLYYILNIIEACKYLPEESQPEISLFYNQRTKENLKSITYPKIKFVEIDVDFSLKIYIKSLLSNKNLFFVDELRKHDLDVLFPFNDFVGRIPNNKIRLISWIPDFQHKFYPQYFNKIGLILRERKFRSIVSKTDGLVLSSQSACDHFLSFYKPPASLKVHLVRFTSIFEVDKLPVASEIKAKYGLKDDYFIVCNQFYGHKNHFIVVKALKLLKDQGKTYHIVFTSKPDQQKEEGLVTEIEQYVAGNGMQEQVKLLGLLPRTDQLALMKAAEAVVQPSKFEGWSTVIEDAKTLQKRIIASDLSVHIEQLGEKGLFFDPDQPSELAECIDKAAGMKDDADLWPPLNDRTRAFANDFLNALYSS
jgi:glycosyltransferase involved in cell wall biosynthesis